MTREESCQNRSKSESEIEIQQPFRDFSIFSYVTEELTQSYRKKQEVKASDTHDDAYEFKNRVDTFIAIPKYLESFMIYGWLQCLDHMLLVYTFLPIRCLLSLVSYSLIKIFHLIKKPNLKHNFTRKAYFSLDLFTKPHELRDLVKFSLILICTLIMSQIDTSVVYHEIRTQSIMKLYIFFNLLELVDKLLSSLCQDALDDILLTVSLNHPEMFSTHSDLLPSGMLPRFKAFLLQYSFTLICTFAHCILMLCQVTTLNVAFNTHHWSLLTVLISNNFVELKSNVFRKLGKTNLFQITCADVRERFHYSIWILIIIFRNISTNGCNLEYIQELVFNGICLFCAEIMVDWVKHAFITKFNFIPANVYREYQVSIAYDLFKCRQGQHNGDYLDVLSRRMGLTPIPLACLINLMVYQTIGSYTLFLVIPVILIFLFCVKILVNLVLLDRAFRLVQVYIREKLIEQGFIDPTSNIPTAQKAQPDEGPKGHEGQTNMRRASIAKVELINPREPVKPYKRIHSDSFCAISPSDILRFHRKTPSPTIYESNIVNHTLDAGDSKHNRSPYYSPLRQGRKKFVDGEPTSGNMESKGTFFDFNSDFDTNVVRNDGPLESSSPIDLFSNNLSKELEKRENHDEASPESEEEEKSRENLSEILSSSLVKQPLADIDRYSMYGGQIS